MAQARGSYLESLKRSPNDPCLHENFAEFLEATGDFHQTVAEWEKTRDLIPHYYLPYYNLGVVLQHEGKLAEARESLLHAAALDPNHGDIRLELGLLSARQGQWDLALGDFAFS